MTSNASHRSTWSRIRAILLDNYFLRTKFLPVAISGFEEGKQNIYQVMQRVTVILVIPRTIANPAIAIAVKRNAINARQCPTSNQIFRWRSWVCKESFIASESVNERQADDPRERRRLQQYLEHQYRDHQTRDHFSRSPSTLKVKDTKYTFYADSARERNRWVNVLRRELTAPGIYRTSIT